jgi:hypothetical protein
VTLDPDPLHTPDEPLRRFRRQRRSGCSVLPFLAVLVFGLAATMSTSDFPATSEGLRMPVTAGSGSSAASLVPGAPHGDGRATTALGGAPPPDTGTAPQLAALSYTGRASWYAASGHQAAVPWWKAGQEPLWAVVSRFADGRTYSVTVLITGWCQCYVGTDRERVVDLSDGAFAQLAPLSVGLIRVTMELTGNGPGLPATSTKEGE